MPVACPGYARAVRIHVASDVHGEADALARAADRADVFVCLGDLILFMDYARPERGMFAELFGADHTRAYIEARTAGRFEDARVLSARAWERLGVDDPQDRRALVRAKAAAQYAELFAAMPRPALLTYGNVDLPGLWAGGLRPGHQVLDGQVVEVGGLRMGFVGGGLVSPMRTPFERTPAEFAARLDELGPVDVLFTHIPPDVPELCYDVVARRFERGSAALRDYVIEHVPLVHAFGHVHQPLRDRHRLGRTECVNVGHFAATRRAFAFDV